MTPVLATEVELRLPAKLDAAMITRRAIEGFETVLGRAIIEDLMLLLSELVTNSVRHASPGGSWNRVYVLVRMDPDAVHCEVCDGGPCFERTDGDQARDSSGGWGLALAERLSSRWGVVPKPDGCKVWFEIDREDARN